MAEMGSLGMLQHPAICLNRVHRDLGGEDALGIERMPSTLGN